MVTMNGAIVYSSGTTTKITWNWGDGDPGAEEAQWFPASHTYAQNGTYLVRVTGWTDDGKKIVNTRYVQIP